MDKRKKTGIDRLKWEFFFALPMLIFFGDSQKVNFEKKVNFGKSQDCENKVSVVSRL